MGGFHPKNKSSIILSSNHMLEVFKRMVIDMKNRGFTDNQLAEFANDPTGEAIGLRQNRYYDYIGHIFEEIKNRSTPEERYLALEQLANEGKI